MNRWVAAISSQKYRAVRNYGWENFLFGMPYDYSFACSLARITVPMQGCNYAFPFVGIVD